MSFAFIVGWGYAPLMNICFRTVFSIISLYVIDLASKGFHGRWKTILENPVLLYLGKISYGIYLFHMFIPLFILGYLKYIPEIPITTESHITLFFIYLPITLLVATFSWHFIEKPVNNLKNLFEYKEELKGERKPVFQNKYKMAAVSFSLLLLFITVNSLDSRSAKNSHKKVNLFPGKVTGLYQPDISTALSDSTGRFTPEVPFTYSLVSLYLAWGAGEMFDFPVAFIKNMESQGNKIFITWEPWTATFPEIPVENKDIYQAILEGKYDSWLKKQCDLLKQLKRPVMIRWAHNIDKIDCPWAAVSSREIELYKKANAYLYNFMQKQSGNKVEWVWPAPSTSRIADYYPQDTKPDYIGFQAINDCPYQDKNCPDFSYLYEKFENCLVKHKIPKEVPVFISELGSAEAGDYGKSWVNKAVVNISNTERVKYCTLFFFNNTDAEIFFPETARFD